MTRKGSLVRRHGGYVDKVMPMTWMCHAQTCIRATNKAPATGRLARQSDILQKLGYFETLVEDWLWGRAGPDDPKSNAIKPPDLSRKAPAASSLN